jgi:pimeloyl-ACP methyl ester carboxylesterase
MTRILVAAVLAGALGGAAHGRGINARANARIWGDLPGRDGFVVINPAGQGRKLELYSWGDPAQIADLARMPTVLGRALPWVEIDRRRIYAAGGSMGGQETLLLVARYPRLLAGALSCDAPTNLSLRYREFAEVAHGARLQPPRPLRSRRRSVAAPWGVVRPEPARVRPRHRPIRCSARDLVEPGRPRDPRRAGTVRAALSGDRAPQPEGAGCPGRRALAPLPRDALVLSALPRALAFLGLN